MTLEITAKKRKDDEESDWVEYSAANDIPVRTLYMESIEPNVSFFNDNFDKIYCLALQSYGY